VGVGVVDRRWIGKKRVFGVKKKCHVVYNVIWGIIGGYGRWRF